MKWADKYFWGVSSNSLAERAYLKAQKYCDKCKDLEKDYNDTQAERNWPIITIYF